MYHPGQVKPFFGNILQDYNIAQGTTHPSDLSIRPPRDINLRYITIENSGVIPVCISISISGLLCPSPRINYCMKPGEIKHVAINPPGSPPQFLHIFDAITFKIVGDPYELRTDANQFVLRNGINKWFVQPFKRPSYRAAF